MNSNVIPLRRSKTKTNVRGVSPIQSSMESVAEAIEKTIDDALYYCSESARHEAMLAALRVARDGGNFMQCMEAAEETMIQNGYRFIRGFLMFPTRTRCRDREMRMVIVAKKVREVLSGKPKKELAEALIRARRVIDGNGTISTALYFSVGPDYV